VPRYLLTINQPDGDPPPPDILGPIMRDVARWDEEARAAGAWVFTAGLHPAGTATVVDPRGVGADGEMLITDGPYTEGKEHVGGFTVIDVPDLDAALGWARRLAAATTLPIEVRPVAGEV
jgi:hypothetical protein